MNIISNLDSYPVYRKTYSKDLQSYLESFLTDSRKSILKTTAENRTKYLSLVAENLIDEHNVHAMIRSSECFGLQDFHNIVADGIILKPNKSITRGSMQWTHIYNYSDGEKTSLETILHLKQKGYKVYGSSSYIDSKYTPNNIPIDHPLVIVMGSEHTGISQEIIDNVDGLITIPMYGFTESFNVSVAASLLIQPIISRIRNSNIQWKLSEDEIRNLYFEWMWNSIKHPQIIYKNWLSNNSSYHSE